MNQNKFVSRLAAVAAMVAALVSGLAREAIFPQKAIAWTCDELWNAAISLRQKASGEFSSGYIYLGNSTMQDAIAIQTSTGKTALISRFIQALRQPHHLLLIIWFQILDGLRCNEMGIISPISIRKVES